MIRGNISVFDGKFKRVSEEGKKGRKKFIVFVENLIVLLFFNFIEKC